jgi:putative endonuclease
MAWLALLRRTWSRIFPPLPLGARGARAAARFLQRRGYIIVARGQRDRLGELDLVAVDGRTIVFVEVKTRSSNDGGHPADAVDQEKQRRLTRAALAFQKQHDLLEYPARFDIIAITWPVNTSRPHIEHFRHAFQAQGHGPMFS